MKRIVSTVFSVLIITIMATSQVILSDSIFFEAGKSNMSCASTKTLEKIIGKVKTVKYYEITLTAYVDKSSVPKKRQSLAMERFQEICTYLIKNNMGPHIRDIEIVTMNGADISAVSYSRFKNRIDMTIEEQFPDPEKENSNRDEITELPSEPDTVITTAKGTRVKIQGGSFFPLKISDYTFEIKELFTPDDFIHNNISTTTSDRFVIKTASAFRILAIPKNSSSPIPVKLQKPVIILIPVADSLIGEKLILFYQAIDSKSFITWKRTMDSTIYQHYDGNSFYMIKVCQLGWVMVGTLLTSCNCIITTPRFQEQKLNIVYPDMGTVVFFDNNNREYLFNIPCAQGEQGFKIFIQACDHTGQMFSLERTFSMSTIKKETSSIYKIRKRDYVKL